MSHDANRAVSLVDLVVTAVVGAMGDELAKKFAALRGDYAAIRLEIDRLKARPPQRGIEGPPGRDAHYIRAFPWHAERYGAGAVVQHVGGLWEALTSTDAEPGTAQSGWSLIYDGTEPNRIETDPDGWLVIVYRRASGTEQRFRFWRPGGYVGVWDAAAAYVVNDTVTYDGSLWLAMCSSTTDRPGSSSAWRLIVKHGRDARRGRP